MKLLVTGSRGFVGSRLVSALKQKGHSVKEFDLALGNNLLNPKDCEKACEGIDAVYHLAAVLDEGSKLLFEVNVKGTENILEAAARAKCRQFIFLSTAGVHGNAKGPIDENTPVAPATKYEKSKAEAEKLAQEFQELVPVTIIRSSLVLGPNEYWASIVKLVGKGFPLIGSGKQPWQVIYADDLVSALVFALGKERCMNETFVVAEEDRHSLRELYSEVQRQLGKEQKTRGVPVFAARALAAFYAALGKKSIVTMPHIERLARERSYNTKKINELGWKAKTNMRDAVQKTVLALQKKA